VGGEEEGLKKASEESGVKKEREIEG